MPGIQDTQSSIAPYNLANIVTPAQPVVTPDAVKLLTDSFRQGAITADDIMDRVGELGKSKRKAEISIAKSVASPEAEQARQAALQAQTQQSQLAGGTAAAQQGNIGLAAQTQAAQLKAALWDAQLHGAGLGPMQDVLMKANWPVVSDPTQPVTPETRQEIARRYTAVVQHQAEMARAQDFLAKTDKTEMIPTKNIDAQGNEVVIQKPTITYGGKIYDPSTRQAVEQFVTDPTNLMPSTWDQKGQPKSPHLPAAGQVEVTPKASISTSPEVTPATVAPQIKPEITPGQQTSEGLVTEIKKPLQQTPEQVLKDIQAKDSYKRWDKSLDSVENLRTMTDEINSMPPGQVRNEKDIALVETAIKLYDPEGVIRSFKWDKTAESRPLNEFIHELVPLLTKKEALTTGQRERLVDMSSSLARAREAAIRPDLQRVADVEKQWGRPVLNNRERGIISGESMLPPKAAPQTPPVGAVRRQLGGRVMVSNDGGKSWRWE